MEFFPMTVSQMPTSRKSVRARRSKSTKKHCGFRKERSQRRCNKKCMHRSRSRRYKGIVDDAKDAYKYRSARKGLSIDPANLNSFIESHLASTIFEAKGRAIRGSDSSFESDINEVERSNCILPHPSTLVKLRFTEFYHWTMHIPDDLKVGDILHTNCLLWTSTNHRFLWNCPHRVTILRPDIGVRGYVDPKSHTKRTIGGGIDVVLPPSTFRVSSVNHMEDSTFFTERILKQAVENHNEARDIINNDRHNEYYAEYISQWNQLFSYTTEYDGDGIVFYDEDAKQVNLQVEGVGQLFLKWMKSKDGPYPNTPFTFQMWENKIKGKSAALVNLGPILYPIPRE